MRGRTLILFVIALALAGGTAMMVRSWLAQRATVVEAAPAPAPPQQSVMVARVLITRGQILKPGDLGWQAWPASEINKAYILSGGKTTEGFAGWVAREPFVAGECGFRRCRSVIPRSCRSLFQHDVARLRASCWLAGFWQVVGGWSILCG